MADPDVLTVSTEVTGDTALVTIAGGIDMATAHLLEEALAQLEELEIEQFQLHMGEVEFMDSSGFRPIIRLAASHWSGAVTIVGATPFVRRLFHLTGIDRHVQLLE